MVNAKLHIICGNCGSNDMFKYNIKLSINDAVEPPQEYQRVSIFCDNCSTIHQLDDNAELEKPEEK